MCGVALIHWQVLILTAIILLEINWHKCILSEKIRTLSKDVKKKKKKKNDVKNKAIKASN